MESIYFFPSEGKAMRDDEQTAQRIIDALQAGITERAMAGIPNQDLVAKRLAILELTRLASMPKDEEYTARMNALIAEFGAADIKRWKSRIGR